MSAKISISADSVPEGGQPPILHQGAEPLMPIQGGVRKVKKIKKKKGISPAKGSSPNQMHNSPVAPKGPVYQPPLGNYDDQHQEAEFGVREVTIPSDHSPQPIDPSEFERRVEEEVKARTRRIGSFHAGEDDRLSMVSAASIFAVPTKKKNANAAKKYFASRGQFDEAACEKYRADINKYSGNAAKGGKEVEEEVEKMIKYFEDRVREPPFLILPDSVYMGRWDLITLTALIFTAFVTPYEVALLPGSKIDDSETWDGLFWVNNVVNLIFVKDMVMQFFLAYRIPGGGGQGMLVRNFRAIRKNYLSSWFTIDLVSIIPFDWLAAFSPNSDAVKDLKIIRVIRLLRLLKLARIFKASRIFKRLESRINIPFSVIGLIKFAILLLMVGHWMACLWCMVGGGQEEGAGRGGFTWINGLHSTYIEEDRWLTAWEIYTAAFYWSIVTITSVGYGDITPVSVFEMQWCTFCLLWGSCVWAYIIGNACGIVSNLDIATIEHQQTMDQLNSFMSEQHFSKPLKTKVRSFFNQTREIAKGETYKGLIERMSPSLKEEVTEKNCEWIHDIYYLKEACPQFSVRTLEIMVAGVFCPQEQVKINNTLCAVSRGVASRGGMVKTAGTFWGEDFILNCWDLQEHVETRALTYLELLMVTKEQFYEILDEFDDEKEMVHKARIKMAMTRGILKFSKAMLEQGLHGSGEIQKAILKKTPLPTLRDRRLSVAPLGMVGHGMETHMNPLGPNQLSNNNHEFVHLNKRIDNLERLVKKIHVTLLDNLKR